MRHSRECLTTVVKNSCERLTTETFARMSHDSREIFVRASHDSRETIVRVSHDVRANFKQFYFSQLSLEMVLFMSHICHIVQIAESSLRCVCERLRRVGDGFTTNAMTWRRFCDDFVAQKSTTYLKLWRTVRDEIAMHARTLRYHVNVSRQFATVLRIDSQTHRELVASQ